MGFMDEGSNAGWHAVPVTDHETADTRGGVAGSDARSLPGEGGQRGAAHLAVSQRSEDASLSPVRRRSISWKRSLTEGRSPPEAVTKLQGLDGSVSAPGILRRNDSWPGDLPASTGLVQAPVFQAPVLQSAPREEAGRETKGEEEEEEGDTGSEGVASPVTGPGGGGLPCVTVSGTTHPLATK